MAACSSNSLRQLVPWARQYSRQSRVEGVVTGLIEVLALMAASQRRVGRLEPSSCLIRTSLPAALGVPQKPLGGRSICRPRIAE